MQPLTPDIFDGPYAPYWDPSLQRVLMCDFLSGNLISIDYRTKNVSKATIDGVPVCTFIIPLLKDRNQLLVSNHLSAVVIEWIGTEAVAKVVRDTFTVQAAPEYATNLWNTAAASPKHTFVGGTFRKSICADSSEPNGELFTYSKKCGVKKIEIPDMKASNGIVWNAEGTKFYHIAACEGHLREFEYDSKTGKICRIFYFIHYLL